MSEIKFSEQEFFIPMQSSKRQRDQVYRETILEFAIENNLISMNAADNWENSVGKVYTITNFKEAKNDVFTVGEINPYNGFQILAILYSEKFYAVINFNPINQTLDYSMISLQNNSDIIFFKLNLTSPTSASLPSVG